MIPVLSRSEMRELDRTLIEECSVPSLVLMENAGRGAAEVILGELEGRRRVTVVCGGGNNGGDGFVVARRLLLFGHAVRAVLAADPSRLRGDALASYRAFSGVGGAVARVGEGDLDALGAALDGADLIVDGLFGTGLDREIEGFELSVVERMNRASARRLSLDLPSGLDADTGVPLGAAVRADRTATFGFLKRGLTTPLGAAHAGRVEVIDLGAPLGAVDQVGFGAALVEPGDARAAIAPRSPLSHKGSSGRVLVIAGSPGKIGAALLAAEGALRAGAGLVTIGAVPAAADALDQRVLEAMTARIDPDAVEASLAELLERADVVAIGPGLGADAVAEAVIDHVALDWPGVVVMDADAVTHFKSSASDLAEAKGKLILTPHPGEMGRLLGISASDVEADRFGALATAVERTRATVLLKGSHTLVGAPGQKVLVNPTGHPVLATGGAGDVLAGVVAALAAGTEPYRAAFAGAYVHGLAASRAASARGIDRGLLAHEVAEAVPHAIAALSGEPRLVPV